MGTTAHGQTRPNENAVVTRETPLAYCNVCQCMPFSNTPFHVHMYQSPPPAHRTSSSLYRSHRPKNKTSQQLFTQAHRTFTSSAVMASVMLPVHHDVICHLYGLYCPAYMLEFIRAFPTRMQPRMLWRTSRRRCTPPAHDQQTHHTLFHCGGNKDYLTNWFQTPNLNCRIIYRKAVSNTNALVPSCSDPPQSAPLAAQPLTRCWGVQHGLQKTTSHACTLQHRCSLLASQPPPPPPLLP